MNNPALVWREFANSRLRSVWLACAPAFYDSDAMQPGEILGFASKTTRASGYGDLALSFDLNLSAELEAPRTLPLWPVSAARELQVNGR